MNHKLFAAACLAAPCLASPALAQTSGARNQAMGGTGVASSRPEVAAFINPAMIRHGSKDAGISIVLPFVGVVAADPDELVDGIDDLQDSIEALQERIDAADVPGANALRPVVTEQLTAVDQDAIDVLGSAGVGVVVPLDGFTVALSARSFVDLRAIAFVDPNDVTLINSTNTSADLDDLDSAAVAAAAGVTEFGVTLATGIEAFGREITIGITPKAQTVETYNYAVSVSSFDEDDVEDEFDDDQFRDRQSGFNVDVGAAIDLTPRVTAGISIQNLISDSYDTVITDGRQFEYRVEPRPTAGIAYSDDGLTLTGDLELLATSRFEEVDDSQFARVGVEYDLAGWVQVRAGYALDIEDTQEDVLSAGLGLSPFETVRIDLVGQYADNGYGAGVQIALTF
ncbi:MAG: conjugal transfer protein TraF [Planctomycetota bacterium]